MLDRTTQPGRPESLVRQATSAQVVVGAGVVMVAAQLLFRAWALHGSYYFTDDYRLMLDAQGRDPDWSYAFASFDSHLMPMARMLVWLVTEAGPLNWGLTAAITLGLQLAAGISCLWMLVTLFTARWFVLAPLALYLTSVLTMPAFMWWAAGLNQIPYQASFFCSVTLWVMYLRSRRWLSLLLALLSVALGVAFYEKALIIGLVLAFLALGYFASGNLRQRLVHVVSTYPAAVVPGVALAGAYLYYYLLHVPRPFESTEDGTFVADDIASSMLGSSLPTGLLGGPWQWWRTTPPIVLADPPDWTVHLVWVVLVLVILYSTLRRTRTIRGWALLATYVLTLYALLTVSRGQLYGGLTGLEYRYLTDAICAATLTVGLVFAEVRGAVESSEPREDPLLRWQLPRVAAAVLVGLVAASGLVTSYRYVGYWHHDNAGKDFVRNLQATLERHEGSADLPPQILPPEVMPSYTEPDNRSEVFLSLLQSRARFPDVTDDLMVIAPDGQVVPAVVRAATSSKPGSVEGCGWQVERGSITIPLVSGTYDWPWWLRVGYLASADSRVTVSVGDSIYVTDVHEGLGSVFLSAPGVYDAITIGGLDPGTSLCIHTVEVGDPVPQGSS